LYVGKEYTMKKVKPPTPRDSIKLSNMKYGNRRKFWTIGIIAINQGNRMKRITKTTKESSVDRINENQMRLTYALKLALSPD